MRSFLSVCVCVCVCCRLLLIFGPNFNNSFTFVAYAPGNNSNSNPPISIFDFGNIADGGMDSRESPPKAIVDATPLQAAMDKNKECMYNNIIFKVLYAYTT